MIRINSIVNNTQLDKAFAKLEKLYDKIPETKGCLKYIKQPENEGGCGAWCCRTQNPSVYYVEFLYAWRNVLTQWNIDDICLLIERALKNYLEPKPYGKGCVFFDDDSLKCKLHDHRPYNCRMYCQDPKEEFRARSNKLRVLYQNRPDFELRKQCDLPKTVGKAPTKKDTKKWWKELMEIEKSIGVKESELSDNDIGTYRTFHDHIILQLFPNEIIQQLTQIKMNGNQLDKKETIYNLVSTFRERVTQVTPKVHQTRQDQEKHITDIKNNIDEIDKEITKLSRR